ncbi:hypothetical protein Q5H93_03585 [Hymenobacter sp. ASUV-10]|uniref:Uncharacterized protein n=1 Tax=Hymenobacter aranciens TaxID=3063996 RepID=A0ABT9B694_9BACT|nr:hypothetical protein [Hymenobacter sp. ASUV-10]MDO7873801.1 hypothetical protein [Hymenobacter sp. ASUV-10]
MRSILLASLVALLLSFPRISFAQPYSFNPSSTWSSRLLLTPPALYLPAGKQQLQRAITYVVVAGKRLRLEELHYDQQGRLDTSKAYTLSADAQGNLQPLLQTQRFYRTQLRGDSLRSEVEHYFGPNIPSRNWRISGSIPLTEPLLGTGHQAHQLPGATPGQADTLRDGPGLFWAWSYTPSEQKAAFHRAQRYSAHDYVGCTAELDLAQRRLTAHLGTSRGGSVTYRRRYEGRSQNYTETCHSSWVSGGGGATTEGDLYRRTVRWRKGLCRSEHFVVLSSLTAEGTYPEFTVYHAYTFY